MKQRLDYLILLLYFLLLFYDLKLNAMTIISLCLGLTMLFLCELLSPIFYYILASIFLLSLFIWPTSLPIVPYVIYGLIYVLYPILHSKSHKKAFVIFPYSLSIVAIIYDHIQSQPYLTSQQTMFIVFGLILSPYLAWYRQSYNDLQNNYLRQYDDSQSINIALAERNHALIGKQNCIIYSATLTERNRIAREIHDNVGHLLTRSILLMGVLKTTNKEPALSHTIVTLDNTLNEAMNTIRDSVHDLHDESINLEETLTKLVDQFIYCPIVFTYQCTSNLSSTARLSIISIVREALSNIVNHSHASMVSLIFQEHPGYFQLNIQDNGPALSLSSDGIGLLNMHERVRALNGSLTINTVNGFQIYITLPKMDNLERTST